MTPELVCEDCGKVCGPLDWHCEGARLRIRNLPTYDHAARQTQTWGLWRYAAMLPTRHRVSLGASGTPLVRESSTRAGRRRATWRRLRCGETKSCLRAS